MEQIPSNTPVMESKPGPAGWVQVWIKAVTKPSEKTFVEITDDPEATSKTAFTWAVIAGALNGLLVAFLATISMFIQGDQPLDSNIGIIIGFFCGAPIAGAIMMPLSLAISAGISQWIAKLFGGTGSFEKLAFAFSAIWFPLILVSMVISLFSAIPLVGLCISLLSYVVIFYQIYLQIVAVKAVNRFDWGPAIGSVLIPGFVIFIFCGCIVIGGLMVLGPQIGEVFNQINQGLAP